MKIDDAIYMLSAWMCVGCGEMDGWMECPTQAGQDIAEPVDNEHVVCE
jgi:hypothetical protein